MIEPSRAMRQLFDQHESLRAIMDDCEQLADEVDAGRGDLVQLVREVAKLRVAFEAHNRTEEQLLPSILRELDAFGDVRVDYMLTDHIHEHRALHQRLDVPTAELRATLYDLRAHLAAEERTFLSARVLRDDLVTIESTG
jgi:ABC-type transporter Mla subunit MlaD